MDRLSITFYVLAHDGDPSTALAMASTWLAGENVKLVVAPGTPFARRDPRLSVLGGLGEGDDRLSEGRTHSRRSMDRGPSGSPGS